MKSAGLRANEPDMPRSWAAAVRFGAVAEAFSLKQAMNQ
jgi:hypothetical protein